MAEIFLRIATPVNGILLRLPLLHRLLSRTVLLLAYTGRRTGIRRTLPVQYIRDGDTLTLFTSRSRRWWPNFIRPGEVRVLLRRRWRSGEATAVTLGTEEMAEAFIRFFDSVSPRKIGAEQARRSVQSRVMIRVTLQAEEATEGGGPSPEGQEEQA